MQAEKCEYRKKVKQTRYKFQRSSQQHEYTHSVEGRYSTMRWMNCMNYLTNLNLHLKFIHCTLGGLGWKQYQTSLAVCILNNKTTQVYVAKRVQWGTDIKHLTRRSRPKPTHCVSSLARRRMSCHDRAIYAAPIQQTVSIDLNRSY